MTPLTGTSRKLFPTERQIADRLHARPESKPTASWSGSGILWNGRVGVCRDSHVFRPCKRRARRSTPSNRYHQRMDYEWDAVVIGGGIIGLAVGRELARRGKRTAIIEERTIASGATQASAGVLAPYIEAPGEGALHDLTVRSLSLYDRFIADLQQDAGTAVEYRRQGTLEVASCPASGERLRAAASTLAAAGVEAEWIDGAAGSAT